MKIAILPILFLALPLPTLAAQSTPQGGLSSLLPEKVLSPQDVVLRIGGMEITRAEHSGEVNRLIPLNYFHATVPQDRREEFQQQALESLIERTLILLDAKKRAIVITEKAIRIKFKETLKKVGPQYDNISEDEFDSLLKPLRARVVRRLLIETNDARFEAELPAITEKALKARFTEYQGQLFATEKTRFSHILVKLDPSAGSVEAKAAMRKLEEIKERIDGGVSFADMAKEYSEDIYAKIGGDIGYVTKAEFAVPGLATQAFALQDNQISSVMNSIYGYHLFWRMDTKERVPLTLEQAAPQLKAALEAEQNATMRKNWIASLRNTYPVEVLVSFKKTEASK